MTLPRAANPWAIPDGRLILPAGAPREQWLAARRKGLGSSDVALLMGVAEGGSEYGLWLDKVRGHESAQSGAMQRGQWLEPHLADHFAGETGLSVRRCGLIRHRVIAHNLATPDRLVEDGACLEIKSMGTHAKVRAQWRDGGIAAHAYCQLQWQLMVSGRAHGWMVAYEIDQPPMIRGPVDRDESLIARMNTRATAWWASHVIKNAPPPVDLETITDEEIRLRWPQAQPGSTRQAEWPHYVRALLAERAELKAAESGAKARAKEIDQALKVMIGDAEVLLVGDRPMMTLKNQLNNPSVDPSLEVDHPDIYSTYITRGSSRRIHVVKGWDKA